MSNEYKWHLISRDKKAKESKEADKQRTSNIKEAGTIGKRFFLVCIFQVRENRGIELLLDCSQADGRNPLITQWVVLAVRNLCEDNLANQEVIRSIETKGKMDNDMMDKIGVQIKQL